MSTTTDLYDAALAAGREYETAKRHLTHRETDRYYANHLSPEHWEAELAPLREAVETTRVAYEDAARAAIAAGYPAGTV